MSKEEANQIPTGGIADVESLSNDEKFRKAMEAAPLAMLKVNHKGIILFANQSALTLFGYEESELLNQPVETLVPEEFRKDHHQNRDTFTKNPHNRRMAQDRDLYGLKKDGSLINLQVGLTPLIFTGEHQILVTIQDISDQKRLEKAQAELSAEREKRIRESERQRLSALKLAKEAEDARKRAEAAEKRLATVASDLAFFKTTNPSKSIKHRLGAFHLRDMIRCGNQIRRLCFKQSSLDDVATKIIKFFDQHFIDQNGNKEFTCVHFFRTKPFAKLAENQKMYIEEHFGKTAPEETCLVHSGSEFKDQEIEELFDPFSLCKSLPKHFAAPLSSARNTKAPVPLVMTMLSQLCEDEWLPGKPMDPERWIVDKANPGYLSIISKSPLNATADSEVSSAFAIGGALIDKESFLMIAQANTVMSEETFEFLSHLNLSIKLALLPLCDHEDRTIEQIKTVQNLLKRKQNLVIDQEDRLRKTMEQLERTNAELDQFAYIASHDLQAPLHGISNLADFLIEDLQETISENSRNDLLMLKSRTSRMKKLLNDLLEYARIGHQKPFYEDLSLKQIVSDIVELFEIPETFKILVPQNLPMIKAPRIVMDLIFRNLVGNALKHHDRDTGNIEITCTELGNMYELGVKDDGPGIDPQYHEQVFKVFNTLKPRDQVEGSGMGLAIVEKTIQHYGGSMSLDSEEGKGAHFKFTWPQKCD